MFFGVIIPELNCSQGCDEELADCKFYIWIWYLIFDANRVQSVYKGYALYGKWEAGIDVRDNSETGIENVAADQKNALLETLLYVRMTPVTVVSGKEIFILWNWK